MCKHLCEWKNGLIRWGLNSVLALVEAAVGASEEGELSWALPSSSKEPWLRAPYSTKARLSGFIS